MALEYKNLDEIPSGKKLLASNFQGKLRDILTAERVKAYDIPSGAGWHYNFAAKLVDDSVLELLQKVADEQQLIEKYQALLSGEMINTGEKRKVLHQLTRGQVLGTVVEKEKDLGAFYQQELKKIETFCKKVHSGEIKSPSGTNFTHVVQIGIGGSDLGPRALYLALENFVKGLGKKQPLKASFISNVDPDDGAAVLANLNLDTSLFILVSKSGTTQETLANENLVRSLLEKAGINSDKHMIAVTSETSPLAKSSRYLASFFMDDYIGGRFSSTSPVGATILSLAFGPEIMTELLSGAHEMDKLSLEKDIQKNPVLLDALIGVWERNTLGYQQTAILPYSQALSRFPAHLQQLDMESNGKQVNRFGQKISYSTGPIIFGEPGTNGQHSFYQLLHQGTDAVPLQFIGFLESQLGIDVTSEGCTSQEKLNANLAAQIVAFAKGSANPDPNKNFPGERPSSLLYNKKLSAKALGALLAHFENKIMFQGFCWNINSFDQEGVQLGKVLTKSVLAKGEMDPALKAFADILKV